MASKPQYSLASSSRGTSACSKRVVPHVFKMKRLLETNMLLSLKGKKDKRACETFEMGLYESVTAMNDLDMRHSNHSNTHQGLTNSFFAAIGHLLAGKTNIRAECMSMSK